MNAYEIIDKKKRGEDLSKEEIDFMVMGYLEDRIPSYQMSALLMAIYFQGLSDRELGDLTLVMRDSGEKMSHDYVREIWVDKHSTGGVGDKTSLIILPILASLGLKIPKMSGRGLGHTGGTIDKLESIPGFKTDLSQKQMKRILGEVGAFIIGQSGELAPADKKIYSLRDVTATVDSIPLIASSIMSKKLAGGADGLVLDVKVGSGAFMKTLDEARILAEKMLLIGSKAGIKTSAVLTNMDEPLGQAIGNRLEVYEAIRLLMGKGPRDLEGVSLELASHMLSLATGKDLESSRLRVKEELESGRALEKFYQIIEAQGADLGYLNDLEAFINPPYKLDISYQEGGVVEEINAKILGLVVGDLGGGRKTMEDKIDPFAGIYLYKKIGDRVDKGDLVFSIYSSDKTKLHSGLELAISAFKIGERQVACNKILGFVES